MPKFNLHFTIGMTFNPPAALKWILGAYNKLKKYIVILDDTTKHRDMYYAEWAEKPEAHDMVKKFISGIPNTHCGMGLSIALQDENRF